MKKTKLFGLALIAAMTSFSACTNDAEEVLTQENEIKLTSEITPSRAASNLQSTQIVAGQEVGVTITGIKEGQEHNNIAWSVGDNGALTNTGDAVYYGDGTATITAYHPFNDDWDESTSYAFSVSTDQSTNAEYLASDLLWATASSAKTENPVPLTFSHKLAKINVTLVPENEDDDLNGATISIYNTKTSTTFNPTTGAISTATGEPQEIIAGVTTDDAYTASAIVIPQEVSGKFIKITHEGKTYYYTLASAKTLETGTSYSFTLTVKGKQLINTGSSINPWNPDSEEGEEGDAEEEIMDDKSVILTTAGTLSTLISEEERYKITSLTISGPLNGDDIAYLYTIIPSFNKSSEEGKVVNLDLSNASIVAGGNPYASSFTTENNIIGSNMFSALELKSLILPKNTTQIYSEAFSFCSNLKTLTIPTSVTKIWAAAFRNTAISSIIIPSNLTELHGTTFLESNITSIIVEENNPKYDSRDNCNAVIETATNILIGGCKGTIIPNTVIEIGQYAFTECDITTITIPSSVSTIASYAFHECSNLAEIHCNNSLPPTIDNSTFLSVPYSCKVYVPNGSKSKYQTADYWKEFTNIIEE